MSAPTGTPNLAGTFTFPGSSLTVHRMGYGAMQLAGKGVFGPPRDHAAALAVLREVVADGINHIDTSDFYGPHVTNLLIREALHPYPAGLTLVTKVGARRGPDASWIHDVTPAFLRQSVEDNLRNLALDRLPVVNLRLPGPTPQTHGTQSLEEPFTALAELQREGLIEHLGLSNVSRTQFDQATSIAPVVCVQNFYNIAQREDDSFLDYLDTLGVAWVPFFPLGGFSPLQSSTLDAAAASLGTSPLTLALAWLLHRSPNVLLIPGTSSVAHLRENLRAADLSIPGDLLHTLDTLSAAPSSPPA